MPVGGDLAISLSNLMSHYELPPRAVKRLGTGLFDDRALAGDESMEGAWFAAPSPGLRQQFEQRFRDLYDYFPPRLATLAYDSTALAAILARRGLEANNNPAFDYSSITNPNGFNGELYDIEQDKTESNDLFDKRPEDAARLRKALDAFVRSIEASKQGKDSFLP